MPFDDNNRDSDSDDKRGKPDDNLSQNGSGADTPKKDERPKTVLRQGTTPAGGSLTQKDIPQEFGHLRLIKKIGHEGGMGVVFQAQNINLDSERAVKILHPMLAQRKDIAGSFVREAQITDKLDHPNIVRVYEVGTFSEFFFIEMELIDTFELPPSNQLPIDISLIVCLKVCEALQFSHTASFKHKNQQIDGVVHRDVKPGNILVSKTGQVKLADFGIAKLASAESLTMAGVGPVGTFSYMSPEQLNDEKEPSAEPSPTSWPISPRTSMPRCRRCAKIFPKRSTASSVNPWPAIATLVIRAPRRCVTIFTSTCCR
jgi:serine/threonine protein kinase